MIINWIQIVSSIFMTSIIWFVQIVHYPLFLSVPGTSRTEFSKKHQKKISILVVPGMIIEITTLLLLGKHYIKDPLWCLSLLVLITIWLSTFLIQVPLHKKLLLETKDETIIKLIGSNWIRTILWTCKSIIIIILLI